MSEPIDIDVSKSWWGLKLPPYTDRQRMDFLERSGSIITFRSAAPKDSELVLQGPGWGTAEWICRPGGSTPLQSGLTARHAIDTCMAVEDPGWKKYSTEAVKKRKSTECRTCFGRGRVYSAKKKAKD